MPKKHEKKGKLRSLKTTNENKPVSNDSKYDNAWRNCYQHEKIKLKNAKHTIKCLTEKLRTCQKNEAEKDDTIEDFKQSIEKINDELTRCTKERDMLKAESKSMKLSLLEKERKYTNLEENYDQNVTSLNLELSKLNQELQVHITSNAKFATEIASSLDQQKAELLQKTEKVTELEDQIKKLQQSFEEEKKTIEKLREEQVTELKDQIKKLQQNVEQEKEKIEKLRQEKETELEDQIKQLQQNFKQEKETLKKLCEEQINAKMLELEAMRTDNKLKNEELIKTKEEILKKEVLKKSELEAMRTQNSFKDEQLIKIQNEKLQVEKAKNNEIRELKAKLDAVNRVLGQQQHIKEVQPITTVPSNHRENPHQNIAPNTPNINIAAIEESSQQPKRRRSERDTVNDFPSVSQTSQVRVRSIIVNNEPNSSDSDTDISIFRPDSSFIRKYMVERSPRPQGFGRLKRPFQTEFIIPETSDSENNFDKMKRSK